MAPLHPNFQDTNCVAEDKLFSRYPSRSKNYSSSSPAFRKSSKKKQERHFMQRSDDAYITNRSLRSPSRSFQASYKTETVSQRVRFGSPFDVRDVDYRRSLVVEKKVENLYGIGFQKPRIPEVDYGVEDHGSKKPVFGVSKRSQGVRLSVFKEKSQRNSKFRASVKSISEVSANLLRSKSSMRLDLLQQDQKPSNLKSALKLSKSDSRLDSKLEVKWDAGSDFHQFSDWTSETSGSKSEHDLALDLRISPKLKRKVSKSISKSLSKSSHFKSSKSNSNLEIASEISAKHSIPRVKVKNSSPDNQVK